MTVTYNGEAMNGFGLHQDQVSDQHKILAFKFFFAAQILYKVATCTTKVSLLLLYLRIFTHRTFRVCSWITMGVVVVYNIISILVSIFFASSGLSSYRMLTILKLTVFQCNPIAKSWNKKLPGTVSCSALYRQFNYSPDYCSSVPSV